MFHPNGPTFLELTRQALSSTQHGYDLLAPKFDVTPFRTPDVVLEPVSKYLSEIGPFENAIDLCCGTGAGMTRLADVTQQKVVGLDFSEGMLAQAKANLARQHDDGDKFEFRQEDISKWNSHEEFDLAVCFGALGHILPRQEDDFVRRVSSSLRPDGRFVFVTSRLPAWYSISRWAAIGFNSAMHVRNFFWRPPFIMFYLTFLWPDIERHLSRHGLQAKVIQPFSDALQSLLLIDARKIGEPEANPS